MKLKIDKQKLIIIGFALLGALLIMLGGIGFREDNSGNTAYTDVSYYTAYLENRIRELCTSVDGITDATVFLTLESSSERIYSDGGSSDYLIISNGSGEEAVMMYEIYPRVRGIAVVCTGGELPRVRETITELLSAAFDLQTNKIRVAGN